MTIHFNPPPGWPTPPATWVPHDEWMPEPDWPKPPEDWTFWDATVPPSGPEKPSRNGRRGLPSKISFPVATVAAQSTVSLAALFPARARQEAVATFGGYGSSAAEAAAYVPGGRGRPMTAEREYYQPRGSAGTSGIHGSGVTGSVLNGAAGALSAAGTEIPFDPTARPEAAAAADDDGGDGGGDREGVADGVATVSPGIRLSPVLRLVAHPSGLRVQFRVGGPVAVALAEVLTPAIEAATPGLSGLRAGGDVAGQRGGRGERGGRGDGDRGGRESGLWQQLRGRRGSDRQASGEQADRGGGTAPGGSTVLSIRDLARRALAARRDGDRAEAAAVEQDLCSLHRQTFSVIRHAVVPLVPVTPSEAAAIHQKAFDAAGANAKGLSRAESAQLKAVAAERAEAFIRASNVSRRVLAGRRQALADGAWRLLQAHDPAAAVAVVDEAMRLSGGDVTCLDAGVDPTTRRAYVTVLLRFPTIGIVAEEVREVARSGKAAWRTRTPRERNGVYAAALASAVLASAKQVASIAIAADDVNVVVVRPTPDGRGAEPIYVGVLDREDVSLRHPDADPLPLVISSAVPNGIRIQEPQREVSALDDAADRDGALREIVDACVAAEAAGAGASAAEAGRVAGETGHQGGSS